MLFSVSSIMLADSVAHWALTFLFYIQTANIHLTSDGNLPIITDLAAREWIPVVNVRNTPFHSSAYGN